MTAGPFPNDTVMNDYQIINAYVGRHSSISSMQYKNLLLWLSVVLWSARVGFCHCHNEDERHLLFDINEEDDGTVSSTSSHRILTAILPFTTTISTSALSSSHGTTQAVTYFRDTATRRRVSSNLGYSHMSAALLAMTHFNERNSRVVPELEELTVGCEQYFDMVNSTVADSQGSRVATLSKIMDLAIHEGHCADAIVDGYYFQEAPSLTLGDLADALQLPFVSSGGFDLGLTDSTSLHPEQSSRVFADVFALAEAAVKYLQHIKRDDFVGLLHSINPTSVQIHEAIKAIASGFNIRTHSMDYIPATSKYHGMARTVDLSLRDFLPTGYRTIVVVLDDFRTEIPLIAKAAKTLNINRTDFVWILLGNFDVEYFLFWIEMVSDPDIAELLLGVAAIQPVEGFTKHGSDDPFYQAWKEQADNASFKELVKQKNPKTDKNEVGYFDPEEVAIQTDESQAGGVEIEEESYFRSMAPGLGSGFVYDAVIALGLGYCGAERETKSRFSTRSHTTPNITNAIVKAIQKSSFKGASGHVVFDSNGPYPGQRLGHSVSFAVYNIKLPSEDDLEVVQVTDILDGSDRPIFREWESIRPFVHADGTTTAPHLLRAIAEQNYLTRASRGWGLSLFALSMLVNIAATIWIFVKRNHRVLKAGQPEFLHMVTLGSTLFAATIIPNSFDESYGWSTEQLSHACNVSPWFIMVGFMLIYSGLWLKLWRVNKVLQFARARKVTVRSVMGPALIFFAVIAAILAAWAAVEGFEWNRVELDELTGESAGGCGGNNTAFWFTPIVFLMMIPITLTARMAWLTRDVDSVYSESHWIVIMIVSQVQLLLISIPLLLLVDGMNPNVRYVGQSSVFAVFSLTTMFLIFGPKLYEVYFAKVGTSVQGNAPRARGSTVGGVYVSGLSVSLPNTTVSRYSVTRASVSSRGGASIVGLNVVEEGLDLTETNVDGEDAIFSHRETIHPGSPSKDNTDDGHQGGLAAVAEGENDAANSDDDGGVDMQRHEQNKNTLNQENELELTGKQHDANSVTSSDSAFDAEEVDNKYEVDGSDDDLSHMSSQADQPSVKRSYREGSSNAFTIVHSNIK